MRLLFFVEHFRRAGAGAENYVVSLCLELARRGYDVHVAAETHDGFDGITVHPGLAAVEETLRTVRPDVTVDWGFLHAADVHRLGGGTHTEFLRYNLSACPRPLRWLKRLGYRTGRHRRAAAAEAVMLRNPQALFLPNSAFCARQALASGASPEAVHVLHNGVDTTRFSPPLTAARRGVVRQAWGLAEGDVAFLFVAHNLRLKNLALLRTVFGRLHREFPSVRLVVAGKRRPGFAAPYLVYAGATGAMEEFYGAADALHHPAFYDSFANVVLEAMSCGLPVVVSDCSGMSEMVSPGEEGWVLPVTGAGEVAARWQGTVRRLALQPEMRRAMGGKARTTALAHSFPRYVDEFEGWLAEAYARKARRATDGPQP